MKVNPYLYFNDNCTEAVTLYEKAFDTKVVAQMMPIEGGGSFVAHAEFKIGGDTIFLCDAEHLVKIGDNVVVTIQFDADDSGELSRAKMAFDTLKESGEILMELEEQPWSKCFGILIDKFGVKWNMCGGLK